MKKLLIVLAACAACLAAALTGCSQSVDYSSFISEMRSEIYTYSDDNKSVTLYCVRREQPYNADGICGEPCELIEIYVELPQNPTLLEVATEGFAGEMNYEAVENRFTASYTHAPLGVDYVDVTLVADGTEQTVRALNVKDSSVMSCTDALICAVQHDKELFTSLTSGAYFNGEIFVRLLYDEGCYYFVGVCDRDGKITAWLLDGISGKVIATKKM